MDTLERAQLCVANRRHQFIMSLGGIGKDAPEIKAIVALIDWDKEIEWATMCYDEYAKQNSNAVPQNAPADNGQGQSGS